MNPEEIPLMFQAQINGRCQLQRNESKQRHQAYDWKDEWTKPYPKPDIKPIAPSQSAKVNPFARPSKETPVSLTLEQKRLGQPPQFGKGVQTHEYSIRWRLVCNSGQDETIIRPTIGAKGYPYYPGSSMKGAFKQACNPRQSLDYCGGPIIQDGEKRTQPGLLRFHGGYPIDTSWTHRLVDPVHGQEAKQVIQDQTTNANVQISLYRVTLRFGISSDRLPANDPKWKEIWQIWEKALSQGLGNRVSAGYGYFNVSAPQELLRVALTGTGVASTLLAKEQLTDEVSPSEFRPNMFKAALRGHTLRLLGGMTDPLTAQYLTKILWGGFGDRLPNPSDSGPLATRNVQYDAIQGVLGVHFEGDREDTLSWHKYQPQKKADDRKEPKVQYTPIYDLKQGTLRILLTHPADNAKELTDLATQLVQFTLLLGGFGKSWRRIDHRKFYPTYTQHKPTIGCHWEFGPGSEQFYLPIANLTQVKEFIDRLRQGLQNWATSQQVPLGNCCAESWREAWYPYQKGRSGVQVWGRISSNDSSQAIHWFHQAYQGNDSIAKKDNMDNPYLTGKLNQTGRIWHRMYPHYQIDADNQWYSTGGYVEFLTIFPGVVQADYASKFLEFLAEDSNFTRIW